MSWYRTGTIGVTVGSKNVVGTGTNFIANTSVGEALLGPDGKIYEIEAVVSATALTLATNYLGATASGQAYVAIPTQSYLRDLASQVATLVSNYSTSLAAAVAGRFSSGTAAVPGVTFASDQDTGLFSPSANNIGITTGGTEAVRIAGNLVGVGTTAPTAPVDIAGNGIRIRTARVPASATAAGNQGDIAWGSGFIYVCTATNTWRRAALSAW